MMSKNHLKPWTPDINPETIPDDVLKSERGRRNALRPRRKAGTGEKWSEARRKAFEVARGQKLEGEK
jgi:hypothetical protein